MSDEGRPPSRRRVLRGLGAAAGVAGLAGCSSDSGGSGVTSDGGSADTSATSDDDGGGETAAEATTRVTESTTERASTESGSPFETVVDETVTDATSRTVELAADDTVEVSIDVVEGNWASVHVERAGNILVHDGTGSSNTWTVQAPSDGEYSFEFETTGRAVVTVATAEGAVTSQSGTTRTSGAVDTASGTLNSTVDELELVSSRYTDTGIQGRYPVTVTVRNTGSEETEVTGYYIEYTVYDAGGTDITKGSSSATENPTIPPGDTTEVLVTASVEGSPSDVASYEVTLTCDFAFADGVYCEDSS